MVKTPEQKDGAFLCSFSCKFVEGLKKYKSENQIQISDCAVFRRQQAAAEIQRLFICSGRSKRQHVKYISNWHTR